MIVRSMLVVLAGILSTAWRAQEARAQIVVVVSPRNPVTRNHADAAGPTVTHAFYAYGGYRFGNLVPYLRYDELRFPAGDLYYTDDDVRLGIAGARYDFSPRVTSKAELRRRTTVSAGTFTEVAAQIAVGF